MNYRDFFKNKKLTDKDLINLIPEGVSPAEFRKGVLAEIKTAGDEFVAAKIASRNLQEDANYYSRIDETYGEEEEGKVCEEHGVEECATCGCGDPTDTHEDEGNEFDMNDGLPTLGGALAVPHIGQPIMMGKIVQVGGIGKGPASGELSGMTNMKNKGSVDKSGVPAKEPGDKEPLTAGGQKADNSIASKSVGGPVTPGEGQKQGGPNTKGCIAGTSGGNAGVSIEEGKQKVRQIVKEVLKEITFDKATGKWVRIDEGGHKAGCQCGFCKNKGTFGKKKKEDKEEGKEEEMDESLDIGNSKMAEPVNVKMGASYKVVQPNLYKIQTDTTPRSNQYNPKITEIEITEMYDDEEECKMNERYVELANAQRNLSENELAEMKTLREKIDMLAEKSKKKNWIQGATKGMRKDKPCTGEKFGGPTCRAGTKRYNLAKTFKKMGKRKDETAFDSNPPGDETAKCTKCGEDYLDIDDPAKNPKGLCPDCSNEFQGYERDRMQDFQCGDEQQEGSLAEMIQRASPELKALFQKIKPEELKEIDKIMRTYRLSLEQAIQKYLGKTGQPLPEPEMATEPGEVEENTMQQKIGPAYKKMNRQYRTAGDDFAARVNQFDPEMSELAEPEVGHHANVDTSRHEREFGHPGQPGGYKTWKCTSGGTAAGGEGGCGYEVTKMGGTRPLPKRWPDGHVCHFELDTEKEVDEAGGAAVQQSSYRVVGNEAEPHGNLPQNAKQRWAGDVDESTKPSKVSKKIGKGMQTKKTKKNPLLKFQKPAKTHSGVRKRKT